MNPITREVATGIFTRSFNGRLARVIFLGLSLGVFLSLGACSDGDNEEPAAGTNTPRPAASSQPSATPNSGKIIPVSGTASASTPTDPPKLAFDGNLETAWNAGAVAPSWIQLDLGQPTNISKVRLNVSQTPPGQTTHNISGGLTPDSLTPIGKLDGNTTEGQWLELNKSASNVRYLKIETIKSPSWISWREIEIHKVP